MVIKVVKSEIFYRVDNAPLHWPKFLRHESVYDAYLLLFSYIANVKLSNSAEAHQFFPLLSKIGFGAGTAVILGAYNNN